MRTVRTIPTIVGGAASPARSALVWLIAIAGLTAAAVFTTTALIETQRVAQTLDASETMLALMAGVWSAWTADKREPH